MDYTRINYTVAIPALALAVSPLFWTPLADIYGRRIVMVVGCLVAFVASVGSALAKNYAGYMVARFMQGWGVGPASTVGLAMFHDIYSELERGEKVGYWTLAIDLGMNACATLFHDAKLSQDSFSDLCSGALRLSFPTHFPPGLLRAPSALSSWRCSSSSLRPPSRERRLQRVSRPNRRHSSM